MNKFTFERSIQFLWVFVVILSFGCDPASLEVSREDEEPAFQRGKRLIREGRYEDALTTFLKVIELRRQAPESHLSSGLIYLEHQEDPIQAIYHFQQYRKQRPDSSKDELVLQRIEAAKRAFMQSLPGSPQMGESPLIPELRQTVEQLRAEKKELEISLNQARRELTMYQQKPQTLAQPQLDRVVLKTPPLPTSPPPSKDATSLPQKKRFYTVVRGDTLSLISKKMYGTSNRWYELFKANQNKIANPNQLKVGQALMVP